MTVVQGNQFKYLYQLSKNAKKFEQSIYIHQKNPDKEALLVHSDSFLIILSSMISEVLFLDVQDHFCSLGIKLSQEKK